MSKLVDRAIDAAGLGRAVARARRASADALDRTPHAARSLRAADLLALGALADRVRAERGRATERAVIDTRRDGAPRGDAGERRRATRRRPAADGAAS